MVPKACFQESSMKLIKKIKLNYNFKIKISQYIVVEWLGERAP